MPVSRPPVPLATLLACLFALAGCGQPPDGSGSASQHQEPRVPPDTVEAPLAKRPAIPEQPAAPPEPSEPQEPAEPARATAPDSSDIKPEALVLTPSDTPFVTQPANRFGTVPAAEWLAAQPTRTEAGRLLPDLFSEPGNRDRANVEGELLLDGSHGTSRMVDGIGMTLQINTD
ncbi:MAG TPA: hypothetical protein VET88_04310 [Gammaproteobacteria bacterium]|nr:hypothetical protein [Gammaproteobacteria bacterium]